MDILVDIGFFSEYGNINNIKQMRYWFDKFHKCKTIKKETINEKWLVDIIKDCCEKETEKTFSKIDNVKLIKTIIDTIPMHPDNIRNLVANQIKYLGYVDVENYDVPIDEYVVQGVRMDKYNRLWLSLFHLASNQSFVYKCEKKWYDKFKCIEGDLLRVAFRTKEKMKMVGENESGKKLFQKTGEYENVVSCYQILKE